jgi:hypothetical protein
MRLIKLFAYCLLGYVLYELYQGLREGSESGMQGQGGQGQGGRMRRGQMQGMSGGGGRDDLNRALNEDTGRMQNMTGTGRGTTVSTEEPSGTSMPHVVGRGVMQP